MNEERNYAVEKKKSPILIFMLILTCLIIIGTCIYFIYDNIRLDSDNSNKEKNNVNSNENKEDNNVEKELEVTDEDNTLAQELVDNFKFLVAGPDTSKYVFFEKDITLATDLSNDVILEVAMYQYTIKERPFDNLNWGTNDSITVSSNKIKKYVTDIFGKNFIYKNTDIPDYCFSGVHGLYDSNNDVYIFSRPEHGCGGMLFTRFTSKIMQVKKYNDRMEVIEKIGYIEYKPSDNCLGTVLYNHPIEKVVIEKSTCDNRDSDTILNNNLDKLLSYKYTFKKDDTNYYFEKIERIN